MFSSSVANESKKNNGASLIEGLRLSSRRGVLCQVFSDESTNHFTAFYCTAIFFATSHGSGSLLVFLPTRSSDDSPKKTSPFPLLLAHVPRRRTSILFQLYRTSRALADVILSESGFRSCPLERSIRNALRQPRQRVLFGSVFPSHSDRRCFPSCVRHELSGSSHSSDLGPPGHAT